MHILPNISWSKDNQTMKLGELMGYKKTNTFLQKLCRKWDSKTNSRPLIFFKKAYDQVKAGYLQPNFNIFP